MKKKPTSPLRHNESEDLVPLTDKLYTEFSIEMLEERLETDPLLLSGLFDDIMTRSCVQCKKSELHCQPVNCPTCYGGHCVCDGISDYSTCTHGTAECFKS